MIQAIRGTKYNRWTIQKEVFGLKTRTVRCKCSCGTIKDIDFKNLRYGKSKSCGCMNLEQLKTRCLTHGMTKTRFYKIYRGLVNRCDDTNNVRYKNYGGKGIKYEWKTFIEFKNDMYEGYVKHEKTYGSKNTTIDRTKNHLDYCKDNCRWATQKEQARNTTINIMYKGKCLAEWCEILGLNYKTIYSRINMYGRSYKEALQLN